MATMVRAGRYEISGELGRGAMGVVYRATDPVIGRNVAVKTIRLSEEGTGLTRPELLGRFQTEARAAGLLTHPNIVVVYDAGEENGLYFITMELVEGKSVQALLDNGHAFPVPRLLRIIEQTCGALQYAHDRNVIHRDIKPANLMLTADDTVKVTDFGTAKILQFGTVQQTTNVMGTPSYMSPEQVKGRPVDGRSDIFSLGVMFYEMLTGEKPFPGQSVTTVIYKIVNEDPIPPRQLNTSIHPGLNEIVMRALAKEPELRYQNCREMLEDLKNYRSLGMGGNNPDATLVSARPLMTGAIGPAGGGLRGLHTEDPTSSPTVRSLQNRGGNPTQTPAIRRTGPVQVYDEPKTKSVTATALAALVLLGVILYGGYKLSPELRAVRERNHDSDAVTAPAKKVAAAPQPAEPAMTVSSQPGSTAQTSAIVENLPPPRLPESAKPDPTPAPQPIEKKIGESITTPLQKKDPVVGLTAAAADYKQKLEQVLLQKGLNNQLKVSGTGDTLTIAGKLGQADYTSLLHLMPGAPASVHVVDHIQTVDAAAATENSTDNPTHSLPSKGYAAVNIATNVQGATVTLFEKAGSPVDNCQTPCSFNKLVPARYSLQIQKEGYKTVQTAVELRAGEAPDQNYQLESVAKGLFISTRPSGAEVFINGAIQSGKTPVTLPLAAGQFNLVLRLNGYEPFVGMTEVKDNSQTTLNVELKPRQQPHVAWAQVNTSPSGAEIIVDGNSTSQFSPARVQISSGAHTLVMKLPGYQPGRRTIDASEGGTVTINEALDPR
jgi:serine/threonine protein kinase